MRILCLSRFMFALVAASGGRAASNAPARSEPAPILAPAVSVGAVEPLSQEELTAFRGRLQVTVTRHLDSLLRDGKVCAHAGAPAGDRAAMKEYFMPMKCLLRFVSVLAIGSSLQAAAAPSRPNVVLVMADDQGWGDTGYNGHPALKTPQLDELARSGLRFERFYTAHFNCSPTRGSVMTGRHPNRYGTFSPGAPIRAQELTVARVLQSAGYATGRGISLRGRRVP